jgi:hypothetical protein
VAFEDQLRSVGLQDGGSAILFYSDEPIIAFQKKGNTFLISESNGTYLFIGENPRKYQSPYPCQLLDLGNTFALTGSFDAKTMRMLMESEGSGEEVLRYDTNYEFSEAKINPTTERAVFYSYSGMRITDFHGTVLADKVFPDSAKVYDTQYDRESGNVAVLYENAFRLYSGLDGALLREAFGKTERKSVFYTHYGVSVMAEDGTVTLYSLADGEAGDTFQVEAQTEFALAIGGGLLTAESGQVSFNGTEIGSGEIIGADRVENDTYAFAISDGAEGTVFTVSGDKAAPAFSFQTNGNAEVYFSNGFVFISPLNGNAQAYDLNGNFIRSFDEAGFMAEAVTVGEFISADYVATTGERYSFLLEPTSLETVAYLPGFLGEMEDGRLVLDDGRGSLRAVELPDIGELKDMARERLDGRSLTAEEQIRFRAE